MIKKLLAACLLSMSAFAAPKLLGTLEIYDGGTVNNATTFANFNVPSNSRLFVQTPDGGAWVNADVTSCTTKSASQCVLLAPGDLLPVSTGAAVTTARWDAGTYTGGVVSMRCPNGTAWCLGNVFIRPANE